MKELKKLKVQYQLSIKKQATWFGEFDYFHIYRRNSIYRRFSTKQEKSCAQLHEVEYKEYNFKVRCRRNSHLVDAWEDIPSYVCRGERDWKRNSKRKHQYFRIAEV